jgi:16S rRNA (guanine527-N7)-methyltransferase
MKLEDFIKIGFKFFKGSISNDQYEKLYEYANLILKWNKAVHLVSSKTTLEDILLRHILDSAEILEYIDKDSVVADVGTGGGLPSVVLSILKYKKVYAIEINKKKCTFLEQIKNKFLLDNLFIINEDFFKIQLNDVNFITSRAVTSIDDNIKIKNSINSNANIVIFKGNKVTNEISESLLIENYQLFKSKIHDHMSLLIIK